ncbi:hypothetical protein SHKM778_49710 [Streptomyces sp. KM77-8]|uniref:Uncharacterized protein n=1 Tax=Streptomyces haneummycinicus TaxID=3074435 RepID=A0AAT9HMB9_9ACTN
MRDSTYWPDRATRPGAKAVRIAAMAAVSSALVRPYPKTRAITGWARASSRHAAGTTADAEVRNARETSRRRAAVSPSAAAALIRGISAVTRETVMMPCGTTHRT